jgi:hypothetical protein
VDGGAAVIYAERTVCFHIRGVQPVRRSFSLAVLLLTASLGRAAEPIGPERFVEFRNVILPGAREDRWARIPWQPSLWQARKVAAAQGKPIFLWEMDGNPLGCT